MTDKRTRRTVLKGLGTGALTTTALGSVNATKSVSNGTASIADYRDLPPAAKRAFRLALQHGRGILRGDTCDGSLQLVTLDYVNYKSKTYKLNPRPGNMIPKYGLTLRQAKQTEIQRGNQVAKAGSLSPKSQEIFQRALSNGRTETIENFPRELFDADYIEYRGTYYDAVTHHRDTTSYLIQPRRV